MTKRAPCFLPRSLRPFIALLIAVGLGGCTAAGESREVTAPPGQITSRATSIDQPKALARDFTMSFTLEGITASSAYVQIDGNPAVAFIPDGAMPRAVKQREYIGGYRAREVGTDQPDALSRSYRKQAQFWPARVRAPVSGLAERTESGLQIARHGTDLSVPLSPLQTLRYRSMPFSGNATVETILGQQQVPCIATWIVAAGAGSKADNSESTAGADSSELRCRLPEYIETAPGLRGQLTVQAVTIKKATLVPNLALSFDSKTHEWVVTIERNGRPERVVVTVGATDGVLRVVEGVEAGTSLLIPSEQP